jgi:hypothetical protein
MAPKTLDQLVATQLGQLQLALIRLQAQVDVLTEERDALTAERDRLTTERDRLLHDLATKESARAAD